MGGPDISSDDKIQSKKLRKDEFARQQALGSLAVKFGGRKNVLLPIVNIVAGLCMLLPFLYYILAAALPSILPKLQVFADSSETIFLTFIGVGVQAAVKIVGFLNLSMLISGMYYTICGRLEKGTASTDDLLDGFMGSYLASLPVKLRLAAGEERGVCTMISRALRQIPSLGRNTSFQILLISGSLIALTMGPTVFPIGVVTEDVVQSCNEDRNQTLSNFLQTAFVEATTDIVKACYPVSVTAYSLGLYADNTGCGYDNYNDNMCWDNRNQIMFSFQPEVATSPLLASDEAGPHNASAYFFSNESNSQVLLQGAMNGTLVVPLTPVCSDKCERLGAQPIADFLATQNMGYWNNLGIGYRSGFWENDLDVVLSVPVSAEAKIALASWDDPTTSASACRQKVTTENPSLQDSIIIYGETYHDRPIEDHSVIISTATQSSKNTTPESFLHIGFAYRDSSNHLRCLRRRLGFPNVAVSFSNGTVSFNTLTPDPGFTSQSILTNNSRIFDMLSFRYESLEVDGITSNSSTGVYDDDYFLFLIVSEMLGAATTLSRVRLEVYFVNMLRCSSDISWVQPMTNDYYGYNDKTKMVDGPGHTVTAPVSAFEHFIESIKVGQIYGRVPWCATVGQSYASLSFGSVFLFLLGLISLVAGSLSLSYAMVPNYVDGSVGSKIVIGEALAGVLTGGCVPGAKLLIDKQTFCAVDSEDSSAVGHVQIVPRNDDTMSRRIGRAVYGRLFA